MSYATLLKDNNVFTLQLDNGDNGNVLNQDSLAAINQCLDEVSAYAGNCALIIHSPHAKHWCNGIDLSLLKDWGIERVIRDFVPALDALLLRIALFEAPVIANISGNCYAGGALLAAAADFRTMRSDYGRFCFAEINVPIPFSPPMHGLLNGMANRQIMDYLVLTGEAITGQTAEQQQVVEHSGNSDECSAWAQTRAELLAQKDRSTYSKIKCARRALLHPSFAEYLTHAN